MTIEENNCVIILIGLIVESKKYSFDDKNCMKSISMKGKKIDIDMIDNAKNE